MTPEERALQLVPRHHSLFPRIADAIREAVREETEACAKACDAVANAKEMRRPGPFRGLHPQADAEGWEPVAPDVREGAKVCAKAIRARGDGGR